MVIRDVCLPCQSSKYKKNGHIHNGKQHSLWQGCGRQLDDKNKVLYNTYSFQTCRVECIDTIAERAMRTPVIFVAAYVLGILLCVSPVAASNTVPLVTGSNYPPFTDASLPQGGMITEIVEAAFQEMGYKPTITFRPWKRGYEETKKGIFVGTFPYIKTEERLNEFYYSQPINTVYTRIFVTKESSIHRIEDIKGQRICIPLGYGVSKEFDDVLKKNALKHEANPVDLEGCLRMMLSGRKDFFIINEINAWMTIQKTFHTKEQFRALDTIFEAETHHLIVSKTHPEAEKMLGIFNQGLHSMKHKGTLQEIVNKHLKGILY